MQNCPIIEKALWLTTKEKNVLKKGQQSSYVQKLSEEENKKLILILCSLLYAEKCFRAHCKKSSIFIENILMKLHLHRYLCSTMGIWNFNVCHAPQFGYAKNEFRKMLLDEEMATRIVIRHIAQHLGLHKIPEHIFAEYNHNPMATLVAALQRCLNVLADTDLLEDGLLGPQTREKLCHLQPLLPHFFSLECIDEPMILKTLAFFSKEHGINVEPFVPKVIVKRDLKYALILMGRCLKNPSDLRKLPHIFHNNIHVPAYVGWGMEAFNHLRRAF